MRPKPVKLVWDRKGVGDALERSRKSYRIQGVIQLYVEDGIRGRGTFHVTLSDAASLAFCLDGPRGPRRHGSPPGPMPPARYAQSGARSPTIDPSNGKESRREPRDEGGVEARLQSTSERAREAPSPNDAAAEPKRADETTSDGARPLSVSPPCSPSMRGDELVSDFFSEAPDPFRLPESTRATRALRSKRSRRLDGKSDAAEERMSERLRARETHGGDAPILRVDAPSAASPARAKAVAPGARPRHAVDCANRQAVSSVVAVVGCGSSFPSSGPLRGFLGSPNASASYMATCAPAGAARAALQAGVRSQVAEEHGWHGRAAFRSR